MSASAATQVAGIYELAYNIFHTVLLESGTASLVPAATSNRYLGSIALDVLWETQQSLLPLFQVLGRLTKIELQGRSVWNPDGLRWEEDEVDYQRVSTRM